MLMAIRASAVSISSHLLSLFLPVAGVYLLTHRPVFAHDNLLVHAGLSLSLNATKCSLPREPLTAAVVVLRRYAFARAGKMGASAVCG
jgi:hypothetical protein